MWRIQVRIWDPTIRNSWLWSDVRPTHGTPYRFKTKGDAERMMRMCYPECTEVEVRVIKEATC